MSKLYIFPLTEKESFTPVKTGWLYATANKDRWVQFDDILKEHMVDPDYSENKFHIVYNNIPYDVYKDYLDVNNDERVFILKPSIISSDKQKT